MTIGNQKLPDIDYSVPVAKPGKNMWMRVVGVSPDGVQRCMGEGPTWDIAQSRCIESISAFARQFPFLAGNGVWDIQRAWVGRRTTNGNT